MSLPKLATYDVNGNVLFDSQHDRVLSYIETKQVVINLPAPGTGDGSIVKRSFNFSASNRVENMLGYSKFVLSVPEYKAGGQVYAPHIEVMTDITFAAGVMTVHLFRFEYKSTGAVAVTLDIKLFRR